MTNRWPLVRTVLIGAGLIAALAPAAVAATTHREHELNDSRRTASGPLLSGSTWVGTLSTRNDNDWFRIYTSRRTQLAVTVTNTSRNNRDHPEGFQLVAATNSIHFSTIFRSGGSRTITRTVGRGVHYLRATGSPGYDVVTPSTYTITVRSSSKLLTHRP